MITGKDLENRELRSAAQKAKAEPAALDIAARIAAARLLEPDAKDLHCRDCWTRGRDAAIRVIQGP
jgi:hypothetical protein